MNGGLTRVSAGEQAIDDLLQEAHLAAPHELPTLVTTHAGTLGVQEALVYLADLQQTVLVPFGSSEPGAERGADSLSVDGTLAGRAYQQLDVFTHREDTEGSTRVWLPLLDGTERLGVLGVTIGAHQALDEDDELLLSRLRRFAALMSELIVTKTSYGDTIVRTRRRQEMGLAAEMQWGLLPPLTFACRQVVIAGALEPAYTVAGDSVDYAVDPGRARIGIFDGMGHGLQSAQLATLAVAAYRNARRSDRTLSETARFVDEAVDRAHRGEAFTTAVLAELDTENGELRWVNAGHPEPLLLRDGRLIKTLHVTPGLPFGLGRTDAQPAAYSVESEHLQPGDRVLFYTDGVTEARSPDGEFFGVPRLVDLLVRNFAGGLPAAETMRRVVRALLEHQQDRLSDDATLLLAEWRAEFPREFLPRVPQHVEPD
jgi:serine/threonine protein phosphatase PrpC